MLRGRVIEGCCSISVALSLAMPVMAAEPTSAPTAAPPSPAAEPPSSPAEGSNPADAAEPSSPAEPLAPAEATEPATATSEPSSPSVGSSPTTAEPKPEAVEPPAAAPPSRVVHPSDNKKGIALIATGAVFIFGGGHFAPSGLIWRFSARRRLEDLQQRDAPAAEIEQAEQNVERATIMTLAGVASIVVGIPIFIIGVVRQEKGGNKTKIQAHRRTRPWEPSVGLGRNEATLGVRMRF